MALLKKPIMHSATALSPYSIRVEWTNDDWYDVIEVWRQIEGGGWINVDNVHVEYYVDDGLDPETLHTYYLVGRTFDPPNHSPGSVNASDTTYAEGQVPSELVATPLTDTKAEVIWKVNSTSENSIVVQRKPHEGAWANRATIAARRDYYQDTGLVKGARYWWRVGLKYNGDPPSEWSNEDDVTTYSEPTAPSALAITELEDKKLRLTWTLGTGIITGTKIEKSINGADYSEITYIPGHIDGTLTDFLVTDLDPNTQYWFRIRHYGPGGNSAYSNIPNDTTLAVYVPSEFEKWIRTAGIEIVALCEINPGMVLTGFSLVGGKTYTFELAITDRAIVDFEEVYEDGEEYVEKGSINEVEATASTFYFDTSAKILYVHTSTGANPSGFFIEGKFWLYMSNKENITFNDNFYLPFLSLENIPSVSQEIGHYSGGSFTISSGTISLKNKEIGGEYFFDKRFADYVWRDAKVILKIGKPSFTYTQYEEIFTSLIDGVDCNDKLLSLKLKDLRANITGTVSMNKYSLGDFGDMDEDMDGKVIPKVFGTRTVKPACIDTEKQRWKFHDGRIKEVEHVKVNGTTKTKDTHYYVDYQRGTIVFDKSVDIDWEEDEIEVYFIGIVNNALEGINKGADIFKYVMNILIGLSNDDLDHDSIYQTKAAVTTELSAVLYKEENLTNIIRKLENSVRAVTFQDEKGRIGFQVAQTIPPSNVVYVENFHMSKEGHMQKKGADFLFKEINVYYLENPDKKEWHTYTNQRYVFVYKYGKRNPLKSLDIYTYFKTSSSAAVLATDLATKLTQLEKGLVKETLPWMLYGCRAGDLIKLSRTRFYSTTGEASEITVRLLKLEKAVASKKSTITGVIVS